MKLEQFKYDFILIYLKYLTKWNQSETLLSIIKTVEEDRDYVLNNYEEMLNIASFEYIYSKESTKDYIMSMQTLMTIASRNCKLNELFNE